MSCSTLLGHVNLGPRDDLAVEGDPGVLHTKLTGFLDSRVPTDFCPVIFEQYLGTSRTLSLILGGVNVTVYAFAAFASFFTIERFGRRKMFLVGTVGQCVSLIITFACLIPGEPKSALNGAVFGLCEFASDVSLTVSSVKASLAGS